MATSSERASGVLSQALMETEVAGDLSMRCSPASRPSKSKYRLEASIAGVAGEVA